ncbi:MAG: hypothetical protein RL141_1121 [Candidatus Parcubacteria bacterium]|jgi:hypothetical protein
MNTLNRQKRNISYQSVYVLEERAEGCLVDWCYDSSHFSPKVRIALDVAKELCTHLESGKLIFSEVNGTVIYGFFEQHHQFKIRIFGCVPSEIIKQGKQAILEYVKKCIQEELTAQKMCADQRRAFYEKPDIPVQIEYGDTLLKGRISHADGVILEVTLEEPGKGTASTTYGYLSPNMRHAMFNELKTHDVPELSEHALYGARALLREAHQSWRYREKNQETIDLVRALNN